MEDLDETLLTDLTPPLMFKDDRGMDASTSLDATGNQECKTSTWLASVHSLDLWCPTAFIHSNLSNAFSWKYRRELRMMKSCFMRVK